MPSSLFGPVVYWIIRHPRKYLTIVISTVILLWGGQTYLWNPFWLYYPAYPWYALFWAFTLTWIIPQARRVNIACQDCGRVNKARIKSFKEGDTFACKGCGKTLTFTMRTTIGSPQAENTVRQGFDLPDNDPGNRHDPSQVAGEPLLVTPQIESLQEPEDAV